MAVRIGKPKALTATARKLAILVYRTLTGTLVYRDPGADIYNVRQRSRLLRRLRHRADTLGFALVNRETGEVLGGSVSHENPYWRRTHDAPLGPLRFEERRLAQRRAA